MRALLVLLFCIVAGVQPNEPLLSIAVNGSAQPEVFQGSALIVEVSLVHARAMQPESEMTPIRIAGESGGWCGALRLSVTDASGSEVSWPFTLASSCDSPLLLDGEAVGELVWVLSADDSAKLAPGDYQARVTLDSAKGAVTTGWSGRKTSAAARLKISQEPSPLSTADACRKSLLLARYFSLTGDAAQATASVEKALESEPGNLDALEAKGDLLADAGNNEGALAAYSEALAAFRRQFDKAPEPPRELYQKHNLALAKWLAQP